MKFKAKVKGFLTGLEPVFVAATKGCTKDYRMALLITLTSTESGIKAAADGGRMSLVNMLDGLDQANFAYECLEQGSVTVRAVDMRKMLQSFNPEDEIIFEVRQSSKTEEENADSEDLSEASQAEAVQNSGMEVVCMLANDASEMQTLPCVTTAVEPNLSESIEDASDLKVRRDLFVASASRISFAQGFQEYRPAYLYWVMRASKNSVRFVAGSGGRFAVLDTFGDTTTNASKKQNVLIPNLQTPALIEIFGKLSGDYMSFIQTERQLVIRCGSVQAIISQIDPNIKWPDENILLERQSKTKFVTKISNWVNAVKGISATNSDDIKKQRHVHTASITLDPQQKLLYTKSNDQLKSNRKVVVDDLQTESGESFTFKCVSQYLTEAIKNGEDNEYIQVEMDSEATPVVIHYHANDKLGDAKIFEKKDETLGINERYTIFFAPRLKDN